MPYREELYRIANHIASAKGALPDEWQSWADGIESDLRELVSGEQDKQHSEDFDVWFGKVLRPAMMLNGIRAAEQRMIYSSTQLAWVASKAVPPVPEEPPEHLLPEGNSRDASYRRGATIRGWKLCRAAMIKEDK